MEGSSGGSTGLYAGTGVAEVLELEPAIAVFTIGNVKVQSFEL